MASSYRFYANKRNLRKTENISTNIPADTESAYPERLHAVSFSHEDKYNLYRM